ncbi:MAG: alpha-galactosidase [Actinomycetota bacterium]|nr:alpha-galactosidase [Actinomycetota bacterium]
MEPTPNTARFDTSDISLTFDLGEGTFEVTSPEGSVVVESYGSLLLEQEEEIKALTTRGRWETAYVSERGFSLFRQREWGKVLFRARNLSGLLAFEIGIQPDTELRAHLLSPLVVPRGCLWKGQGTKNNLRFFSNGWQCWSPSGTVDRHDTGDCLYPRFLPKVLKPMIANPRTPIFTEKGIFTSEWFGALANPETGKSLVVGFIGLEKAFSTVMTRLGQNLRLAIIEASSQMDGKVVRPHEEVWSEPLCLIPGDLSSENLCRYADALASENGGKKNLDLPVGWGSWYQYKNKVREEDIHNNLRFASKDFADVGMSFIQLDDGYQLEMGDWLNTNERFPHGLKELAEKISGEGKIPGIWLAPFSVTRKSKIFKQKKEWLLKSAHNKKPAIAGVNPTWKGILYYGLDPSHPQVIDWLKDIFSTLRGYGFRFFKLDFLASAALDAEMHNKSLTRAEALRRALAAIRAAVGEDSYIMCAGGPVLLGTGIFDSQRISPDTESIWMYPWQPLIRDMGTAGARNALLSSLARCFLSRRAFVGDPDCILLRTEKTHLSEAERETLSSFAGVLGGSIIFSDDLELWSEKEATAAAKLVPPTGGKPICPDLLLRKKPRLMLASLSDPSSSYQLLMVINWERGTKNIGVSISELGIEPRTYHAFDLGKNSYLGKFNNSILLKDIPAHGSRVLRLTSDGQSPRILGSTFHVGGGAVEIDEFQATSHSVRIRVSRPRRTRGTLTVFLPTTYAAGSIETEKDIKVSELSSSIFQLEFEVEGKREIEVSFTSPGES